MPNAPSNPFASLSVEWPQWELRLGDTDGNDPTEADVVDYLQAPVVHQFSGANELDSIEVIYDLGLRNERIVDTQTPLGYARQLEVRRYDDVGLFSESALVGWGDNTDQQLRISQDGGQLTESAVFRFSVQPFHFGSRLRGPVFRDPLTGVSITQHGPIVFQPLIDGKITNNRSSKTHDDGEGGPDTYHYWIDPESVRTTIASQQTQDGATAEEWDLKSAIFTLCWVCNPDEEFIVNPKMDYLDSIFGDDVPKVLNIELTTGEYLPKLLDELLLPHGYSWFLHYDIVDDERRVSIRFFKLGEGFEQQIFLQRPGEVLDPKKTNTTEIQQDVSVAELANKIICQGAFIEREVTIELKRGWPTADDALKGHELAISDGKQYPEHQNAWRLWVGNEAGDYTGTRTTVATIDSVLDLSSVLGEGTLPKRRQFLDCLTQQQEPEDESGLRRRPPFIQWFAPDPNNLSDESAGVWRPVPDDWGARVLEEQMAVLFTADEPPAALIKRGDNARLRITATIRGDIRVTATADKQDSSPNLREVELLIDVSDRFFDRQVQTTGEFASVLAGVPTADERDDANALQEFADEVREVEDAALMRCSFPLHGLEYHYEIGDLITKVDGRNLSFNRKASLGDPPRYLQIMGRTFDYAAQRTILHVSAPKETLQQVEQRTEAIKLAPRS